MRERRHHTSAALGLAHFSFDENPPQPLQNRFSSTIVIVKFDLLGYVEVYTLLFCTKDWILFFYTSA
jgi:hypothetical protein